MTKISPRKVWYPSIRIRGRRSQIFPERRSQREILRVPEG